MNQITNLKNQINTGTVVSVVAGMAIFGGIMYAAVASGVKPLKQAAAIAKGGK